MSALILSSMRGQEISVLLNTGNTITGMCKEIFANSIVIIGGEGWIWRVDPDAIVAIGVKEGKE